MRIAISCHCDSRLSDNAARTTAHSKPKLCAKLMHTNASTPCHEAKPHNAEANRRPHYATKRGQCQPTRRQHERRREAQRPVERLVMWLNTLPTGIVAINLTLALLNKTINLPISSAPDTKHQEQHCLTWTALRILPSIAPQCWHLFD